MVQLVEVPPVDVTGGQYDSSQCGIVEWYVPFLVEATASELSCSIGNRLM